MCAPCSTLMLICLLFSLPQCKKQYSRAAFDRDHQLYDTLDQLSPAQAIIKLDLLIEKYPRYHVNYYLKGQKLIALKKYEEAIQVFDQTIKIEPSFRYAYAEKAFAQYLLGDKIGACNAWKKSQGGGSSYIEKYCNN